MATPPNDDTRLLFKLLEDNEWHNYEQIRDAVAAAVPPGRALRKYEKRLQYSRVRRQDDRSGSLLSESDQIRLGAKACAQKAISSWYGKGLMQQGVGSEKQIRLKPGTKLQGGPDIHDSEEDSSPESARGYTEVPPQDSEPPETPPPGPEEALGPFVDPEPAREFVRAGEDRFVERPDPVEPEPVRIPAVSVLHEDLGPSPYDWPPIQSPKVTRVALEECERCGLAVSNEIKHNQWHQAHEDALASQDLALIDEVTLRTILGDVMGQALDRFQAGVQGWFEGQFMQVEELIRAQQRVIRPWTEGDPRSAMRRSE